MSPIDVARTKLGQRESAPNQGAIVTWSVERWTKRRPDESGWARWCAGFACTCLEEGGAAVHQVASLLVSTLWERCQARFLVQIPAPEDLVFWKNLHHVGLLERIDTQGRWVVISGNFSNAVTRSYHRPDEMHGCARIPAISSV